MQNAGVDGTEEQMKLYNTVLGQCVWPSAARAQDSCVGPVLKMWQGHHDKEYKRFVRDSSRSGDAGGGAMTPQQALDTWKARAGGEGGAMMQQCIDLYHHGIHLLYKGPKHQVCASDVGFGGFNTPASQSGVSTSTMTHYCEIAISILLHPRIGLKSHHAILASPTDKCLCEGAYECG
jgi:hypothetical protein